MARKILKSYCNSCNQITNQETLSEHSEVLRDEYACDIHYQIIQCRGCEEKSFRKVFVDLEAAFPMEHGEWDVPESIDYYPKFLRNHREIDGTQHLPRVVERIYSEVLCGLKEEALILAGLGLRGTIEAVCFDLNIEGRNLAVKINKLVTAGYISKKDAARLHGIRFMGNDAAHEIKRPKRESIHVALKIVEHLLQSAYILETEASGKIDGAISDYENFVDLLADNLKNFQSGDELPLAKILGKDVRRVTESISLLESELIAQIGSGAYAKLAVGKTGVYQKSKQPLQHFVIC